MSTNKLTQKELTAVLEWINEQRAQRNLPPRRKILKGLGGSTGCPIAISLGEKASVYTTWFYFADENNDNLPPVVKKFVNLYDNGKLPEYKKKQK